MLPTRKEERTWQNRFVLKDMGGLEFIYSFVYLFIYLLKQEILVSPWENNLCLNSTIKLTSWLTTLGFLREVQLEEKEIFIRKR